MKILRRRPCLINPYHICTGAIYGSRKPRSDNRGHTIRRGSREPLVFGKSLVIINRTARNLSKLRDGQILIIVANGLLLYLILEEHTTTQTPYKWTNERPWTTEGRICLWKRSDNSCSVHLVCKGSRNTGGKCASVTERI